MLDDFSTSVTKNWVTTMASFSFKNNASFSMGYKHKLLFVINALSNIHPIMLVNSARIYSNPLYKNKGSTYWIIAPVACKIPIIIMLIYLD